VPLVVERRIAPGLRLHLQVAGGGLVGTLASFVGDAAANRIPGVRMEGREIELDLAALLFPADVEAALRWFAEGEVVTEPGVLWVSVRLKSSTQPVGVSDDVVGASD
jgi:hypothetical protein